MRLPRRVGLLAMLLSVPAAAQQAALPTGYAFSTWTTGQGLPQNFVSSIVLDPEGYLWVATPGSVTRFDGQRFVPLLVPDSGMRGGDIVRGLVTDRNGGTWVLRYGAGAMRLEQDKGTTGRLDDLPAPPVDMAFGRGDSAWLAAGDSVLWLRTGGRWIRQHWLDSMDIGQLTSVTLDSRGWIWVTGTTGLARRDGTDARAWHPVLRGAPVTVWQVLEDSAGSWVASSRGVGWIPADDELTWPGVDDELPGQVRRIARADSALWIADRSRLRRVTVDRSHAVPVFRTRFSHDLNGNLVSDLKVDRAGRVWVATRGGGLHLIRPLAITRIGRSAGLPMQGVHEVLGDGSGGIWMAGGCTGLVHWRAGRLKVISGASLRLESECVEGLARDRSGRLWVGARAGFTRRDPDGTLRAYAVPLVQPDVSIGPWHEDQNGVMWLATADGKIGRVLATDSLQFPLELDGLREGRIWSFASASGGQMWVGQVGLVTLLNGDSVTLVLGVGQGVPSAPIRGILSRPGGGAWIASYGGGLAWYEPGAGVLRLTTDDGLFDNNLSAVLIDRSRRVWLLGDNGLAVTPEQELLAAVRTRQPLRNAVVFGPADSMPEGNGGFPNAWLDESQRLWLATVDGVASIDAAAYPFDQPPPRARIDRILVNGEPMVPGKEVVVPSGRVPVEFVFSAPELDGTGRLRYRHRLAGYDRDWVMGVDRVARYPRISPGRYTFEVVGRTAAGVEGSTPARIPVVVEAAWWELWWVQALAVALLVYGVWRWQSGNVKRMRLRAQLLQAEISERQRAQGEAARAASALAHVSRVAIAGELATSIAHELNQPLSAVMSNAQAAKQALRIGAEAELEPALDAIVVQSERAAGVMRALRAFVRKQVPERRPLNPAAVVRDAVALVQPELRARGIRVRLEDNTAFATIHSDAVQLQQVLINLVLNAADAVEDMRDADREILIRADPIEEGGISIEVRDWGAGMSEEVLAHVMEPFFTTKATGLGLGIPISRSIVEAHGGTLVIDSTEGLGTSVRIYLPETEGS